AHLVYASAELQPEVLKRARHSCALLYGARANGVILGLPEQALGIGSGTRKDAAPKSLTVNHLN
ncbi:MAG: hypothetical protein WA634_17065, partial [Silvibacterium sp.]